MNSPHPSGTATPTSPRGSVGRPSLPQRHSSQSSTGRQNVTSPGSASEHHPLRHAVGGRQRHAKFALPRNHSSGRNLAKMGRQAQQNEDGRKHARQKSHDADTEIRLPGSLDERPTIRRNMTAYQLPRNTSNAKLKKNLSHGQLTRLQGSGRSSQNLQSLQGSSHGGSGVGGLKGRSKRPKSAEVVPTEKNLHQQEMELAEQLRQREANTSKKVGFAVGSPGDTSDGDDDTPPMMEGSGLQEDDWTDQSASASPYSTRQNTANNSRRPSMMDDRQSEKTPSRLGQQDTNAPGDETNHMSKIEETTPHSQSESDETPAQSVEDLSEDQTSPRSKPPVKAEGAQAPSLPPQPSIASAKLRSPLHAAKDHPNPTTARLASSTHLPAPAKLSNVSAFDDGHKERGSPAPSMQSSQSNIGEVNTDKESDELVSRFIPSTSHPSTGSGSNTGAMNTPKQGSFHTPDEDSAMERSRPPFQIGPTSPGSFVSTSSGAATPALGRSRIELRMMHDKALADREALAGRKPLVPHHIYDRRNETLKSYLNLATLGADGKNGLPPSAALSLGPEIFQGRFKAINTELKVVQKFRDPISEAVGRLRACKGTRLALRSPQKSQQAAALKMSKSAVSLPSRPVRDGSKLSTSASPPKTELANSASPLKPVGAASKSSVQIKPSGHQRRGVSFAGAPPQTREIEPNDNDLGPDAIAQALWDSTGP